MTILYLVMHGMNDFLDPLVPFSGVAWANTNSSIPSIPRQTKILRYIARIRISYHDKGVHVLFTQNVGRYPMGRSMPEFSSVLSVSHRGWRCHLVAIRAMSSVVFKAPTNSCLLGTQFHGCPSSRPTQTALLIRLLAGGFAIYMEWQVAHTPKQVNTNDAVACNYQTSPKYAVAKKPTHG